MNTPIKSKRPRIAKGQLVASTNTLQLGCIKALHIAHYYNPVNFNRVRRVVLTS